MAFKCSRCDCEQHYDGALGSPVYGLVLHAGKLTFVPDKDERTFRSLETKDVKISATMCRECGLLELTGDAAKLRRLAGE